MKKNLQLFILTGLMLAGIASSAQMNITFKSHMPFTGFQLSNIWGYAVDTNEYALVGHSAGMTIVDVTDPVNPDSLFTVPGPNSIWREVRSKGTYAFVTTEGGGGLKIVNLAYLPDSIQYKSWTGDSTIAGQLNTIHALQVDGNYLYLYGSNITNPNNSGHPLIIDVTDPWNPHYVGKFVFPGSGSVSYVHDGFVRNDTGYFAHIYDGFFSIVDLSDKSNTVLLASQNTTNNFSHNSWLSDNSKVLFTSDEVDNSFLSSYDVTVPTNIKALDKIQQNAGSNSVIHNTYILNDYAVTSWYKDGVVIVDGSRPENLVITGYYDTSPMSGGGMDGAWGVYAFFPSGNLLISDMQEGMFVLAPDYKRGCFLEGTVTESGTGNPVFGATVTLEATNETTNSKSNGNYACGYGIPGTYSARFQKTGYITKIISGISLSSGVVTPLDVQLDIAVPFTMSGQVQDDSTGSAVPFAEITLSTELSQYDITADGSGNFSLANIYEDNYDIIAGKWGFLTKCYNQTISPSSGNVIIELEKGIYDDFTFDLGWAISSTAPRGIWEIGEPVGTSYNNSEANPDLDVDMDCSDKAYITGNAGGSAGDDDVDSGKTFITSPFFDITGYGDAYISYYRWFYNGGGFGGQYNDTLKIKINNGSTTVSLENVSYNTPGMSSWVFNTFKISDFITITPTMRVIVEAADNTPGHLVECGFDGFQVIDSANPPPPLSQGEMKNLLNSFIVFPNPTRGVFELRIPGLESEQGDVSLQVYNVLGEMVKGKSFIFSNPSFEIDISSQPAGIYFLCIKTGKGETKTIKVIRL